MVDTATTDEKAKIEIDIPSVTDLATRSTYRWKIIKGTATLVAEGVFGSVSSLPAADLSLGSGSTVADEIVFNVQVGKDGGTFTPSSTTNVTVVRDRTNWWFEPFSTDFGWRTSKPEPRVDLTNDYSTHKMTAYPRETLQSIYEVFRSTQGLGTITKASWLKPSITCFGQFHETLKTGIANNPLGDLNGIPRINMSSVTELPAYANKFAALRWIQKRQTTYTFSDANPTLVATKNPQRVTWAANAVTAINSPNLTKGTLLAIWMKEGSMGLNSQANMATYSVWPLTISPVESSGVAPATADEAKTIYVYDVAYMRLGSDFLLKHFASFTDNKPDLRDYAAALAYFKTKADATGGAGIGDRILSNLTVTPVSGGTFTVAANAAFYEDMLTLLGKFYLSGWQAEGKDISYTVYNMGLTKFNQMKATTSAPNTANPERPRLGLVDWSFHYEIRTGEWEKPRSHTSAFHILRLVFENQYP